MKRILFQALSILILLAMVMPAVGQPSLVARSSTLQVPRTADSSAPAWQLADHPIFLPIVEDRRVYQVTGTITNGDEIPLAGLTVRADSGAAASTNQQGGFVIQGLVNGVYELSVESSEYECSPLIARLNVPPQANNIDFTCSTEIYPVTGTVTNKLGEPLAGVTVTDNTGREVVTDASGQFVMELPAGIHTLTPLKSGSYTADNYQPEYQFEPKSFTVRLGSSKVRAPINQVDFIGLATFADPLNVGAPGLAGYPKLSNQALAVDRSGQAYIAYGTPAGLQFGLFDGAAWTFTVLDAIDSQYAAMALGNNDLPQIAYFDNTNEDLKYIRATGRDAMGNFVWSAPRVVDSTGRVGLAVTIAIDSENKAHLVYLDDTTDNLKYAKLQNFTNHNFAIETVQEDPQTPPPANILETLPSLDLDSSDRPHISFYQYNNDTGNGALMYAYRVGESTWPIRTLAVGLFSQHFMASLSRMPLSVDLTAILEDAGFFNALKVDDYNGVHIAYYNDTSDDLEYAYKSPTTQAFAIEPVDRFESVGPFTSLAVDERGRPHIAYIRQNDLPTGPGGALKYAVKLGNENWKKIHIDNIGTVPTVLPGDPEFPLRTSTTVYLDRSDNPHMLYYDFNTADLKYAVRNKWEFQVVGLVGTLTEPSNRNIILDKAGLPHIAFGGSSLYHGFFDGSAWQFELVDASPTAGAYAAIEIDEKNNIYIAYYDSGPMDLKFATFNRVTGVWTIETVDSTADVGKFLSLILDYNDKPHVSYFDEDNDNLKYAFKPSTSWNIELLDEEGAVGGYTSIDVDLNNRPHVVYANFTENYLKYIYKTGSGWQDPQEIPTGGQVRSFVSLELDRSNRPHIAYFEDANTANMLYDNLKYTYYNGVQWLTEPDTIDIQESVGWWNSMELDSFGDGHISYYDFTNGKLKYAHGDLYDWQAEFVDDMGLVGGDITTSGGYTSLVLDGADRPQFVYYDIANNVLKFAKLNSWELQTAAAGPGLLEPGRPNLGVDVAGNPHIAYGDGAINYTFNDGLLWNLNSPPDPGANVGAFATLAVNYYLQKAWPFLAYYDVTTMELKYNRLDGLGWLPAPVIVDSAGDVGKYASLALYQVGTDYTIHIAYFDEDNDRLKYARLGKDGGGSPIVVDDVGAVGPYAYLTLDQSGRPHISYYDIKNKNLMYAYEVSTNNWHTEIVEANGRVGLFSSLAVDSQGRPHIAYFDDETDDLRYAYKDAGVWHYDVVDTLESTGWYVSLALDGDDNPHISYYEHTNQNLKHAWIYRYNFVVEMVDIAGDVGQFSSLQIDPAGGLHIAYFDATLGNIKYARSVDW